MVGDWHTHGPYHKIDLDGNLIATDRPSDDEFTSNHFSRDDLQYIQADAKGVPNYRAYLGTPNGVFKVYDPKLDRETELK